MTRPKGDRPFLSASATRQERFDAKWMPEPNSGCWIWLGGTNEHGYGVFWNGTRLEKAHRFAFRSSGRFLADDADLCHRCDCPPCVNPDHMFAGTAQDNTDDMWAKARATVLRRCGTAQAQAKLTDQNVLTIRALYGLGFCNQYELANRYSVSQTTIWKVVNNKLWKSPSGVTVRKGCGR